MKVYKTYIQQISYNGSSYAQGSVVDLLEKYNIICQEFPFKLYPESKELPTRDWAGEDGLDVYTPDVIPLKSYEIEVMFLYVGTEVSIREDISDFINFIRGRAKGDSNDTVQSGRLAVYDEYTKTGRKDVVVSKVGNDLYKYDNSDDEAHAKFKVTFNVYDPTTDVTPTTATVNNETVVTGLSFT